MSLDKTFTIQRADMSIAEEGPWGTPEQMINKFSSYEWASELALQSKLSEDDAGEVCPPNFILLRESGVYLQLCPNADETTTIYCVQSFPRTFLGLFKYNRAELVTKESAAPSLALRAISKFMANDETWLKTHIQAETLS